MTVSVPFQTFFFEFPVFRRHLSFFWVGLVQDKGFRPPTPIQSLQKGHLIMATGRLVSACAGKQRPFLSPVCYLHSKEKLQSLQVSLRLQHRIFLGLYSLFFFFFFSQPPSISCYHGEWNACSIQVVGWIGFEVDGWWESLIPPSPNTAPAWFLTFHLPETGNQWVGAEREAGSVLLRCSFSSWMKSAAVRRS